MGRMPLVLAGALGLWGAVVVADGGRTAGLRPPPLLSETGLYVAGGGGVHPRNRPFSPQYPLWSDGATKARWVYLPDGAAIDASDLDAWEFPVGTRFWKEFTFAGRKVETRMLWRSTPRAWTFATYLWNEAQTDAVLAPEDGVPAFVEIARGKAHGIPSLTDCRACHESDRVEVLGFSALQLSTDRDPLAPHAETPAPEAVTLATLVAEGRLAGTDAPALVNEPPRIRAADGRTRAVLGYLSANCGNCHNTRGSLADLGLVLRQPARGPVWSDAQAARLLQRSTQWQLPGGGEHGTVAVTPGAPERSALVYRMRSRRPSSQMPPLGTVLPDHAAVDLVTSWVGELRAPAPGTAASSLGR
jgi:hypothetical protein